MDFKAARRVVLILGALLACLQIYLIAFYLYKIPVISRDIDNRKIEIAALLSRKKEIDPINDRIEELKKRVTGYFEARHRHVRMARIMDRICTAVNEVEGVWLESFTIRRDKDPDHDAVRYEIGLTGYASGKDDEERSKRFTALLLALELAFREKTDRDGNDPFLGARFERPRLTTRHLLEDKRPKFENVMEYALTMRFTLIPDDMDLDETEFKFTPSNRRDPFVAPQHVEPKPQPVQSKPKGEKAERIF